MPGPSHWRRWAKRALVAGVLALSTSSPAWASPIQTRWDNFLAGGTSEWASISPPPITARIKRDIAQAVASPDPTSNVWVQYLHWRRDLNPARFDRWHPSLGPFIAHLAFPSTPSVGPVIHPQPQTIPEPATITLALGLIGVGAWCRRPRRGADAR